MGFLLLAMPPFFNYALAILAIPFILVLLGHALLNLGHAVLKFKRALRRYKADYY